MDKLIELKAQVYDLLVQRQFIQQQIDALNEVIRMELQKEKAEKDEDRNPTS